MIDKNNNMFNFQLSHSLPLPIQHEKAQLTNDYSLSLNSCENAANSILSSFNHSLNIMDSDLSLSNNLDSNLDDKDVIKEFRSLFLTKYLEKNRIGRRSKTNQNSSSIPKSKIKISKTYEQNSSPNELTKSCTNTNYSPIRTSKCIKSLSSSICESFLDSCKISGQRELGEKYANRANDSMINRIEEKGESGEISFNDIFINFDSELINNKVNNNFHVETITHNDTSFNQMNHNHRYNHRIRHDSEHYYLRQKLDESSKFL